PGSDRKAGHGDRRDSRLEPQLRERRPRAEERVAMPTELHWIDSEDLGILLHEKFPDVDPLTVRFIDLHRHVMELPGFVDDPKKSNEPKLEAIQMAWLEEWKDAQE